MRRYHLRWSLVVFLAASVVVLVLATQNRLDVETNIINALPQDDPVIADARYVISHHPLQDRVVVDISCRPQDMELLLAGAAVVESRLSESRLFRQVGMDEGFRLYPELIASIAKNLPLLFTAGELQEHVEPLLKPDRLAALMGEQALKFQNLEGIGQADLLSGDPLGLKDIVLAKLSPLAPGQGMKIVRGRLVSADDKHLLLTAEPHVKGGESIFAHGAAKLFQDISDELNQTYGPQGAAFTVTPMGAYRAALDNEMLAKNDTRRAVLFSTMAIIVLLLVGFPRPLIGMLALLPALAGTIMALFVYSFINPSISILAIGFGGAIISFTVDYGIAYLLFLDRSHETTGPDVSREVWPLGLLAMLTTAASFTFLFLGGFPALTELGLFAALGVLFTFVFVHTVFPFIFIKVPPARREGFLPLKQFVIKLTSTKAPLKAWAVLFLFVVMLFFAKPVFHVDLSSLNSLTPETKAAEELIRNIWGDVFNRIHIVVEGETISEIRQKGDLLTALIEEDMTKGVISSAFLPAMLFPGHERSRENFAAWRDFWSPKRIAALEKDLSAAARVAGFTDQAFAPFIQLTKTSEVSPTEIPRHFYSLLGIGPETAGTKWRLYATLTTGANYQSESFSARLANIESVKIFDPVFFGRRLGHIIMTGFIKVALIVGLMTLLVVFIYLLDIPLTLISVAPTVFALVCTLGTLNLLGVPLGIPVIMMSAVVIGMGTDYALYLIVAWQRYMDEDHPSLGLIRMSIFLSFATTFLGFGVLSLATHAMLKSIGLALLLGIGYSFLGAATIVPILAGRLLKARPWPTGAVTAGSKIHVQRVLGRYQHMEAYTRIFARFKMSLDPMFPRLAEFVKNPRTILDIGCGYGVPAAWLLALYPEARIFGIDPDLRRVHLSARVVGERGSIQIGRAPEIPEIPDPADTVLLLDIIHILSDEDLQLTFERLRSRMLPGGKGILILRSTVPLQARPSFARRLETARLRLNGVNARFRSVAEVNHALSQAGFRIILSEPSAPEKELHWFIAEQGDT